AAIREATVAYRGDCVEQSDIVVYSEWYDPVSDTHTPCRAANLFPPAPFVLAVSSAERQASPSGILPHVTSNQSLELTATRRALSLFDDQVTSYALDARSR